MRTIIVLLTFIINSFVSQELFPQKEIHFTDERTSLLSESKRDLNPLIEKLRSKNYDTLKIFYTQYESYTDTLITPQGEFFARIIAQYIDQSIDKTITIQLIPQEKLVKDLTLKEFLHMEFYFALE